MSSLTNTHSPRWFYISLTNCCVSDGVSSLCPANSGLDVEYEMHMINGNHPLTREFSSDEMVRKHAQPCFRLYIVTGTIRGPHHNAPEVLGSKRAYA